MEIVKGLHGPEGYQRGCQWGWWIITTTPAVVCYCLHWWLVTGRGPCATIARTKRVVRKCVNRKLKFATAFGKDGGVNPKGGLLVGIECPCVWKRIVGIVVTLDLLLVIQRETGETEWESGKGKERGHSPGYCGAMNDGGYGNDVIRCRQMMMVLCCSCSLVVVRQRRQLVSAGSEWVVREFSFLSFDGVVIYDFIIGFVLYPARS